MRNFAADVSLRTIRTPKREWKTSAVKQRQHRGDGTQLAVHPKLLSLSLSLQQHHCNGCRYGGGVDRRRAAVARCLADEIRSHSGAKVFIKQEVPALTRIVNGQREHARMDFVSNLNGSATCQDTSLLPLLLFFSCNPSLVAAPSTRPGHMAKRAEKSKFDRYPHFNLVPFILETTGRR